MNEQDIEYNRAVQTQYWQRKHEKRHPDSHIRCMHDACPECHGTGRKKDGSMCIHMISCPCTRCTPRF